MGVEHWAGVSFCSRVKGLRGRWFHDSAVRNCQGCHFGSACLLNDQHVLTKAQTGPKLMFRLRLKHLNKLRGCLFAGVPTFRRSRLPDHSRSFCDRHG